MFRWLKGLRSDSVTLRLHAFENARNPMPAQRLRGGETVEFTAKNGDVLMTVYLRRDRDSQFHLDIVMNGAIVKLPDTMREIMDKQHEIASHLKRLHEFSS